MVNIVLFAAFSVGLLAFLYFSTVGYIKGEANRQIESELSSLAVAYRGGFDRLNQAVAERASAPGPFFYYLQGADGRKVSGDYNGLPIPAPLPGQFKRLNFSYIVARPDGTRTVRQAEGIAVRLAGGEVLFVAFDWDERTAVVRQITRTLIIAAPIGLVLSLIGGIVISRSASRRADALMRTTNGVMGGDLSLRAPRNGSDDEFDRLSGRLNAMLDWLERLVISTRDTGNAIAHDLRSPLTRVRNRLVTALEGPNDPAASREALETTLEELDRVLLTFSAILRLSRLEAGTGIPLVRIDVSEIVSEMADLFQPVCEDHGLSIEAEITAGLFVLGDRALLGQALANLLDNAVKYTPAGGLVTLRLRRGKTGADIELSVADTGPGIAPDDRQRAVKRFVRLEKSRSEPGSGLGLSLVDAVAEHHGGKLVLGDAGGPADAPGLLACLQLPRVK